MSGDNADTTNANNRSHGSVITCKARIAKELSPRYLQHMERSAINAVCAVLPGAESSDPWGGGHDVWKVGNKSFVFMGTQNLGLSLKCGSPETAAMLIDVGRAQKAPYSPRGGWIFLAFDSIDDTKLAERIATSYLTVRRSLTKKFQTSLGAIPNG
jgi:predicted DNA-binding protein (MmcQ/YjbR family)